MHRHQGQEADINGCRRCSGDLLVATAALVHAKHNFCVTQAPSLLQAAPLEAQTKGELHLRPTFASLQHWVEGLMHRFPHFTRPEGHPVRKKGSNNK